MPMRDPYEPATTMGKFKVSLDGDELKVTIRIFIDSALAAPDLNVFTLQAEPIIKAHWEGKYGFKCSNPAYPLTYKPRFKLKYEQGPGTAHFVMTMTEGTTALVSRSNWWKAEKMGLTNDPKSVKMRPDAASDFGQIAALSKDIVTSIKGAFPFYADSVGGNLSPHAQTELRNLAKQVAKTDAASVLGVTAYGSGKTALQTSVVDFLKAAGLANVVKRNASAKKVFGSTSPKSGSRNYVKVVLQSGMGVASNDDPLFRYPSTIVHEFGHMIGLVDEYGCLSDEAADKMADLNFIYASEKNQFKDLKSPDANAASPESKIAQALLAEWCATVGVEPAQYGTKSISLMSNGSKFYPRHFITLWKAISDLTTPPTQPSEWSIVKL